MTYQYGPAGTDRHAPYAEIEWGPKVERECKVCMGFGTGRASKYADTTTGMLIEFDEFGAPHRTPLKGKQDEPREHEGTDPRLAWPG